MLIYSVFSYFLIPIYNFSRCPRRPVARLTVSSARPSARPPTTARSARPKRPRRTPTAVPPRRYKIPTAVLPRRYKIPTAVPPPRRYKSLMAVRVPYRPGRRFLPPIRAKIPALAGPAYQS